MAWDQAPARLDGGDLAVKKVCAWCEKELTSGLSDGESVGLISHGICPACVKRNYPDLDDL